MTTFLWIVDYVCLAVDLLLQRSDGGIAQDQLRFEIDDTRFQCGNTLLIGLFGTHIHVVSANPLN